MLGQSIFEFTHPCDHVDLRQAFQVPHPLNTPTTNPPINASLTTNNIPPAVNNPPTTNNNPPAINNSPTTNNPPTNNNPPTVNNNSPANIGNTPNKPPITAATLATHKRHATTTDSTIQTASLSDTETFNSLDTPPNLDYVLESSSILLNTPSSSSSSSSLQPPHQTNLFANLGESLRGLWSTFSLFFFQNSQNFFNFSGFSLFFQPSQRFPCCLLYYLNLFLISSVAIHF